MLENSVDSKIFTVALINMIIDGHEPFQSSLLNLIFNYLHIKIEKMLIYAIKIL